MATISDITPLEPGADVERPGPESLLTQAHHQAQQASRERLRQVFPTEFLVDSPHEPKPTRPVVGNVRNNLLDLVNPWNLLEDGAARWMRSDWESPIGMALEASGRPDAAEDLFPAPLGHDPLPSRSLGRLVSALDDGYVLALHGCEDRSVPLQLLLEDLERSLGVASLTTVFFGVRTALGAPPEPSPYDRIMIQLIGERHVAISAGSEHGGGIGVKAGQVLRMPAGWVARHGPQDVSTMHMEISLCTPDPGEGDDEAASASNAPSVDLIDQATWPAWLPARSVSNIGEVAHVLANQLWDEAVVRMGLPGGVFLSTGRSGRGYAAGGFRFAASDTAADQIARLLSGQAQPGADFDRPVLESLLRMGLISVALS